MVFPGNMRCLTTFAIIFLSPGFLVQFSNCQTKIPDDLRNFLGILEPYSSLKNEVIFILDESGSIGADVFPQVVRFTELMSRFLTVSHDYSRLAVLTFSTDVRTHVNYIKNGLGKNMCTFLPELSKIDYAAGWTYTGDAMVEARSIFAQARPGSNKIIILLTDGQSNGGYNLLSISNELKQSGVIIFTVGVAEVNEDELISISTSKDHIYILKEFSLIKEFNDLLKNDTKETLDKVADSSLCNGYCSDGHDCCDKNADCFCGARGGHFECGCRPGYFGDGHKGKCTPCAKGMYKDESGSSPCISCPANSTTDKLGSTSVAQCKCIVGHEGNPSSGKPCKPVECNPLKAPKGGIILPHNCGNTFGSVCTFKCQVGYCPYVCRDTSSVSGDSSSLPWNFLPKEARHCLENGTWSGPDFQCEKIRCGALEYPNYGNHNCSSSKTDFSFGTICHFNCEKGFSISGSKYRRCLENGEWTGEQTSCFTEKCKSLKSNTDLRVKPNYCTTRPVEYGTVCHYGCREGYNMTSRKEADPEKLGIRRCGIGGKWSNWDEDLFCEDVEAPTIKCPKSITKNSDPGMPMALISWDSPVAKDNAAVENIRLIHPNGIQKPPAKFKIGSEKVVYEAVDSSGISSTCSFTVTVLDQEPPQVLYCPADIEIFHRTRTQINVTWDEPKFKDNSGSVSEAKPSRYGLFQWGPPSMVNYSVSDPSGNFANCSFSVKVKPYPCPYVEPPTNGFLSCDKWAGGQLCQVTCKLGYAFPIPPEDMYFCSQKTLQWTRPLDRGNKAVVFPWPDCGEVKPPSGISVNVSVHEVNSCSDSEIAAVKKKFISSFKGYLKIFCKNKGCHPDNVDVSCKIANGTSSSTRGKRSVDDGNEILDRFEWVESLPDGELETFGSFRTRRESENGAVLVLSFDLKTSDDCIDSCENFLDGVHEKLQVNDENVKELVEPTITKFLQEEFGIQNNSGSYYSYSHVPICDVGRVLENGTCVTCPVGTYFDESVKKCMVCPTGTYQDNEGSLSCKECPHGSLTLQSRSRRPEDCKGPCKPGFYSKSGLEPCTPCDTGSYQNSWASTYCVPCHNGLKTGFTGANSSHYCTYPCQVGSYSQNGFPPCLLCPFGTYQPKEEQTSCIDCPSGTTTVVEGAHSSRYCQTVHFCDDFKPCANGATCKDVNNSYECICPPGFASRNCDVNINDCTKDACENNGTCIDLIGGFSCLCLPGFTGAICESDINDCESGPCENGGKCVDLVNNYTCECPSGLSGYNCEINIDDCSSDPCLNDGKCYDGLNDFLCCYPEEISEHASGEIEIGVCDSSLCLNGGSCGSNSTNANCTCPFGYEGQFCELLVSQCEVNPCLNGGTCIEGAQDSTCACPALYGGQYCNETLSSEYVMKFSAPPNPSNYVKLSNSKYMRAITVSFFMQSGYADDNNRGTPISYSYYDVQRDVLVDNAITLFDTNKFILYLHGESFHTGYKANSGSQQWNHYAITWDSFNGEWAFYVDGKTIVSGSNVRKSDYLYPGVFILGQEQDSLGGSFNSFEAFVGMITEFNVWDYAFTSEEIKNVQKKCGFIGNVLSWPKIQFNIEGDVSVVQDGGPCQNSNICDSSTCFCKLANNSVENCKPSVGSCDPNPCKNGQSCVESGGVATCSCSKGFEGKICEFDVDECLIGIHGCSHGCVNTVGSFYCSCPEEFVLSNDSRTCLDTTFCRIDDKLFLDKEQWSHNCEDCVCTAGEITCQEKICPHVNCSIGEEEVLLPDHCCSSCISGTECVIAPNATIETFDGLGYAFQGRCRYLLAKDNINGSFAVHIENGVDNVTEKIFTFRILCDVVSISSNKEVFVNARNVSLPFRNKKFSILDSGLFITVWTYYGVSVKWYVSGLFIVQMPDRFKKLVSGLCGNFNGNLRDDMTTRQHSFAETLSKFISSWKEDEGVANCRENGHDMILDFQKLRVSPINVSIDMTLSGCATRARRIRALKVCSTFWKSKYFRSCHRVVDPTLYYHLCWRDACSCRSKSNCFCNSVLAYALRCSEKGVPIKSLGRAKLCSKHCNNGMVYRECGSACVPTCSDKHLSNDDAACEKWQCLPGCYCPDGKVLRDGTCIAEEDCPRDI